MLFIFILPLIVRTIQKIFTFIYLEIDHIADHSQKQSQKQIRYDYIGLTS